MIRQARLYLVGAVSGTALVGAAIVCFVLLVSAQALRDWPISGLDLGGDDTGSASQAQPASGTAAGPAGPLSAAGAKGAGTARGVGADEKETPLARADQVAEATGPEARTNSPAPGSSGAGSPGGGSGNAAAPSSPAGSGGSGGGSNGAEPGAGEPTPSGRVAGTVNDTVSGVDGAVGGALSDTGVTQATEGAVDELAGPDSAVGQTVDGAAETAGGLLDPNR